VLVEGTAQIFSIEPCTGMPSRRSRKSSMGLAESDVGASGAAGAAGTRAALAV
jgi:hypothetical protein